MATTQAAMQKALQDMATYYQNRCTCSRSSSLTSFQQSPTIQSIGTPAMSTPPSDQPIAESGHNVQGSSEPSPLAPRDSLAPVMNASLPQHSQDSVTSAYHNPVVQPSQQGHPQFRVPSQHPSHGSAQDFSSSNPSQPPIPPVSSTATSSHQSSKAPAQYPTDNDGQLHPSHQSEGTDFRAEGSSGRPFLSGPSSRTHSRPNVLPANISIPWSPSTTAEDLFSAIRDESMSEYVCPPVNGSAVDGCTDAGPFDIFHSQRGFGEAEHPPSVTPLDAPPVIPSVAHSWFDTSPRQSWMLPPDSDHCSLSLSFGLYGHVECYNNNDDDPYSTRGQVPRPRSISYSPYLRPDVVREAPLLPDHEGRRRPRHSSTDKETRVESRPPLRRRSQPISSSTTPYPLESATQHLAHDPMLSPFSDFSFTDRYLAPSITSQHSTASFPLMPWRDEPPLGDDTSSSSNNLLSPLSHSIGREIRAEGPSERLFHSAPPSMTQSRTSVPDVLYSSSTEDMFAFSNESLFHDHNPPDGSTVPDQSDISPLPNIGLCSGRLRLMVLYPSGHGKSSVSEALSEHLSELDRRMEADYVGWRLSDAVISSEAIVTSSQSRRKKGARFACTIPGREAAFTTNYTLKSMSSISVFLWIR